MVKKSNKELITQTAKEFFEKIGQELEFSVEEGEAFLIKIEKEDAGQLIGFRGQTLSALQSILRQIIFRKTNEWINVIIDVNNYRQEQKNRLEYLAMTSAQKARFSGKQVSLSPMSSYERRLIHLALADVDDVETKSQGEPGQRYVIITPKNSVA